MKEVRRLKEISRGTYMIGSQLQLMKIAQAIYASVQRSSVGSFGSGLEYFSEK